MQNTSGSGNYFNVMTEPRAGQLDEISQEETDRDLRIIKRYLEAEDYATGQRPLKTEPSIARPVLVSVWEAPRVKFHREELTGRKGLKFGSKLLLIPWSAEAFERLKQNNTVVGLILEHVTPVDALWTRLKELQAETDSYDAWATEAQAYLWTHYALAVLTREQATAVDQAGFRSVGTPKYPFQRYQLASEKIAERVAQGKSAARLDVARFCHPGIDASK